MLIFSDCFACFITSAICYKLHSTVERGSWCGWSTAKSKVTEEFKKFFVVDKSSWNEDSFLAIMVHDIVKKGAINITEKLMSSNIWQTLLRIYSIMVSAITSVLFIYFSD